MYVRRVMIVAVLLGGAAGDRVHAQIVPLPPELPPVGDTAVDDVVIPLELTADVETAGPDITSPGPDMGDFPNSAFTLPKGRMYVESAPFTYATADHNNASAYSWPFLLRYGVTDDVELRLFGNGGTSVYDPQPVHGFSPLIIDTKIHLWDGNDGLIPAASFEGYLQTTWGSSNFDGGWQPSLNMNFDLPLNDKTNLEWSLGYTGTRDAVNVVTGERFIPRQHHLQPIIHTEGVNVYQFNVQWAIEREVTERLQVFVHGYYAGAVLLEQGAGSVVGAGAFYTLTRRWMAFGSCNAGLDSAVAPVSGQLGMAYAL